MTNKIQSLIYLAQKKMAGSNDPLHDLNHVRRVVSLCKKIGAKSNITAREKQALTIATWWHDAARAQTKKPSFMLMSFFDDMISALMLLRHTIRLRMFGSEASMAVRIILCKSLGTGMLFTRLLLGKRGRELLHILKDADEMDMLHIDRAEQLFLCVERKEISRREFKAGIWFGLHVIQFNMRTEAAKQFIIEIIKRFLSWMQQYWVRAWHEKYFGKKWTERTERGVYRLYQKMQTTTCSA